MERRPGVAAGPASLSARASSRWFVVASPLPGSLGAGGGLRPGVSPHQEWQPASGALPGTSRPSSRPLRQQKGCLRGRAVEKIQRQRRGKVSRANRLSTEPPPAGSPRGSSNSGKVQPPLPPGDRDPDSRAPQGPACSSAAGPVQPAARRGPGWRAAARPCGREQSCQVPSCCLASFSRSFNVHSSRISESSQHQLSSDLFLHGGCYGRRGHLTSDSRPGGFGSAGRQAGLSSAGRPALPPPRVPTSS